MSGLPCGEETVTIWYAVSTKYRNVTDGQTDRIDVSISRVSVVTRYKNDDDDDDVNDDTVDRDDDNDYE